MIDERDLKSEKKSDIDKESYVINPYPRATEAKFDQNAVESVLFGDKKEREDENNGKLSD